MTFEEFKETLQNYEIEGGFGVTLEKGMRMYYLPNSHPQWCWNLKFTHRNKRKAFSEYKKQLNHFTCTWESKED